MAGDEGAAMMTDADIAVVIFLHMCEYSSLLHGPSALLMNGRVGYRLCCYLSFMLHPSIPMYYL